MKSSISRAPITASTGLSDSAQIVRGATNLTTVGAVPYVSASGVLNQDASNFFWDATNHRLGIGTNAPGYSVQSLGTISAAAFISTGGVSLGNFITDNAGSRPYIDFSGSARLSIVERTTSTAALTVLNTGPVGLGRSNTSPTGTLHVYDATASTGVTTLTVKAGAGQSSNNQQEWQLNAGSVVAAIGAGGSFYATSLLSTADGSASNAVIKGQGTWFTGGSATTTKPYLLVEPSGTTSTGWSTSGTGIGVNAASGFAGNLLDLQVAGSSVAKITAAGALTSSGMVVGGNINLSDSGAYYWNTRSVIKSSGDGFITLLNNAQTDFSRLQFGGTTSSFPALKRSGTGLIARLADDSADTWIKVKSVITGALTVATLPASPTAGERAFVTDSNAVSYTAGIGTVVASGGSTAVPVVYDGTNWRIG